MQNLEDVIKEDCYYVDKTPFIEYIEESNKYFPAEQINDPDNFLSLLFYFGMVTIDGMYKGETKFIIPNEMVRDMYYYYFQA